MTARTSLLLSPNRVGNSWSGKKGPSAEALRHSRTTFYSGGSRLASGMRKNRFVGPVVEVSLYRVEHVHQHDGAPLRAAGAFSPASPTFAHSFSSVRFDEWVSRRSNESEPSSFGRPSTFGPPRTTPRVTSMYSSHASSSRCGDPSRLFIERLIARATCRSPKLSTSGHHAAMLRRSLRVTPNRILNSQFGMKGPFAAALIHRRTMSCSRTVRSEGAEFYLKNLV